MKKTLQLEDLSCPSCVAKIEKVLKKAPGVEEVEVKFNSSKVDVAFDESKIELADITKLVESIGFEVKA